MHGAYIASAPNPISQQVFMRELCRTMGVPVSLPAYSWMVRVGRRGFSVPTLNSRSTDATLFPLACKTNNSSFGSRSSLMCSAIFWIIALASVYQ